LVRQGLQNGQMSDRRWVRTGAKQGNVHRQASLQGDTA
jgi:hypothetical protein